MDKELTPKQQTSEAIRQAQTILIMTGQHPSIDQVASTIALSAILRKFGKKVTAVISDDIPAGAKFLAASPVDRALGGLRDFVVQVDLSNAEVDKLKYTIEEGKLNIHITPFAGGFSQRDVSFAHGDFQFDLIIILGVASYARIDKVYVQNAQLLQDIPLVNIDFHRINEQYGAINLIETSAASLAEILIALSESLQTGLIDEDIATTMLTGIMAATDRFTAPHTTAKTMTVAAQMLAMGANQQRIVKGLYRDRGDREQRPDRSPRQPQARQERQDRPERQERPVAQPQPEKAPEKSAPQFVPMADSQAASKPIERSIPEPRPAGPVTPRPQEDAAFPLPETAPKHSEPEPAHPHEPTPPMEDLLPPQHIQLSEEEEEKDQSPRNDDGPHANPTNNPVFAEQLEGVDE